MNLIDQLVANAATKNLPLSKLSIKRNEYLVTAGQINTNLYLIQSGTIRIFVDDLQDEHTIRFGYKGNIITALDSFLSNDPTKLNIQALKKCELAVISKKAFTTLLNKDESNRYIWQKILEDFTLQQMEREMDLLTNSPMEKYRRVKERSPILFQEIPSKYIASYLRMTPETFSRIKKS